MARPKHKRSLTIARHRTSISLEDEFWEALSDATSEEGKSIASLVGEIDRRRGAAERDGPSLSAAIRLYLLRRLRSGTA